MCLPPIPLHASLILAVALPSFRAPLKCVDYSFRVTQVESKHTYSESILLLLLHSVSLQMRNKGLIIPNDLPPSFCQFGLYVLFIAREKQNKTIQKYSPYSVKDFFFPSSNPDSSSTNSSSTPVTSEKSVYGHCAHYLSLTHSIFQ